MLLPFSVPPQRVMRPLERRRARNCADRVLAPGLERRRGRGCGRAAESCCRWSRRCAGCRARSSSRRSARPSGCPSRRAGCRARPRGRRSRRRCRCRDQRFQKSLQVHERPSPHHCAVRSRLISRPVERPRRDAHAEQQRMVVVLAVALHVAHEGREPPRPDPAQPLGLERLRHRAIERRSPAPAARCSTGSGCPPSPSPTSGPARRR